MSQPQGHRLLLVDDDRALCELLSEYLDRFGHRVVSVGSGQEARRALRNQGADLIILDIMLPDVDGLTLCREFRQQSDTPIIMLSARGEVADRVVGLELGADDYVPKPFEPRELAARIDSVLRRMAGHGGQKSIVRGELRIELHSRRVQLAGDELDLTTMEFELLRVLMEHPSHVLSRDRLMDKLRGIESEAYDRSIDMLVSRVRQKLGDDPRAPRFIKTVWGSGYQFIGAAE